MVSPPLCCVPAALRDIRGLRARRTDVAQSVFGPAPRRGVLERVLQSRYGRLAGPDHLLHGGGFEIVVGSAGHHIDEAPDLSLIHISEPTRLGMISYAVFCLKKKKKK